jgi:hypothetical protein
MVLIPPPQVDLYSLGVVVFEMWHRFSTAMERAVLLRELREAGKLPVAWESQHPQVARLIRCVNWGVPHCQLYQQAGRQLWSAAMIVTQPSLCAFTCKAAQAA